MDESPTNVLELMKRMNEELGTTFIFSTHDPSIVGIADHIIRVTDKAFDDFAAAGTDEAANRRILGLDR